jgi:hypothetical protein
MQQCVSKWTGPKIKTPKRYRGEGGANSALHGCSSNNNNMQTNAHRVLCMASTVSMSKASYEQFTCQRLHSVFHFFCPLYKCGKRMNVGLNGDLLVETVGFAGVKIGVDLF